MSFSQDIKQSNTDEWYTTRESVELIVPYLLRGGYNKILCPFDTEESQYVKVLAERGFDVTYSHLDTGTDFFDIDNLTDYDAIVSNPPFSLRQPILERLFQSGVPFAMILNFNGLFDSFTRLGCIGCPMGSVKQRMMEFERYPKYKNLYLIAFQKMIENRGGYNEQRNSLLRMADSGGCDARIHNGELQEDRGVRDYRDMTPEEIMEWWIQ